MKAEYWMNDGSMVGTAEVLCVKPWDGEFFGPFVCLCEASGRPGYWQGFDRHCRGVGQLVAPQTLVIHNLSVDNLEPRQRALIYRKFAVVKYKRGRIVSAWQAGKTRDYVDEFFGKRQRVYVPHFSTALARYRSPMRCDAPLGWEI